MQKKRMKILSIIMAFIFMLFIVSCDKECSKGHTWGEWENSTATCVEEIEDVEKPLADHSWKTVYDFDTQSHWKSCLICEEKTSVGEHDGDLCSVCGYKKLPSLKEVMSNLAELRNYTYELDDEIFDVTTTFRYTENAFYYHPSQASHGGEAYGYAQSNDGKVFKYVIEDNEIVPDHAMRKNTGEWITSLWDDAIISFYDFNIEAFADTPTVDNTYTITDPANKTLFAALAGYGDMMAAEYVTVTVEVLSENSIRSVVHFSPSNEKYTGDCIGVVKNIGTTEIAEIEQYLSNGFGAKPEIDEADFIVDFLMRVKNSNQYKVEVVRENKHYFDILNETYYYSYNESDVTNQKGYLVLTDKIYQFTMVDGKVKVSNEISYTSGDHSSLWAQGVFKNLSSINLSEFSVIIEDEIVKMDYNISIMNSLYSLSHDTNFFFSVNEKDYITFDQISETAIRYTYHLNTGEEVSITISEIDTASNAVIEEYIASGGDLPDPSDISALKAKFKEFQDTMNYTIDVTSALTFAPIPNTGNKTITFAEKEYFQQNLTTSSSSFGYGEDAEGIYNLTADKTKGEYVLDDTQTKKGLYTSGLFSSFKDIDLNTMTAVQQMDGTFKITDSATMIQFINIAGFNGASGVSMFTQALVTITDTTTTIKLSGGFYGSITLVIHS